MGSGSRVLLCKSTSSLVFSGFAPAFACSCFQLRFKSFPPSPNSSRAQQHHRMAAEASSSANDGAASPSPSPSPSPYPSPASAIDFLSLCHNLKKTKRAGWVKRDIINPESISDHMYRMGLMALIAPDIPGIDRAKCIKMAIVHDIAEAIVGDITPSDGISKAQKSRQEREALDHMCKLLRGGLGANEINQLWMEYEENSSPEAKIVKDFDKVEMILQALEYENEQERDLDEFFQSTAGKFQTELGKAWALEIASRRKGH
ncbi:hypothetical protein P3X46_022571 [Hevea brasiliensis]|uniref:5'-deoxynucleotidase n=1 Tax=Hevea brasiliensis TaxID=3981 RepID=A0ABQ9L997_HEVBR|nr:uncharacterized protein LOC110642642 isoform X2 [Hevea brasiliensis]KAJ9162829.1 hypothetical protein P3X46_022571 [Hevea brasiliensis]